MKSNFSKFIYCNYYNSPLLFQFSLYGNDVTIQKFKTLKGHINTFQPVDTAFSFSHCLFCSFKNKVWEKI